MLVGSSWSEEFVCQIGEAEMRHAYMADQVRTRIALQIRALRDKLSLGDAPENRKTSSLELKTPTMVSSRFRRSLTWPRPSTCRSTSISRNGKSGWDA